MSARAPRLPAGPRAAPRGLRTGELRITVQREDRSTVLLRLSEPDGASSTLTLTPGGCTALGALLSRLALAPPGTTAVCLLAADRAAVPAPLP